MTALGEQAKWEGPPRRIVLLDDEPLILRAVSRALWAVGLEPVTTTDAEEALRLIESDATHVVVSDLHMPAACGASFLANVADVAPDALRVLISADPDFRPKVGTLAQARVHAIMNKTNMTVLGAVILEQLRARVDAAVTDEEREALARRVARGLSRPGHEDDAHRERVARSATSIAVAMGLSADEIHATRLGALLHDVGQVAVPEELFSRGGVLSAAERGELERHPTAGCRIVEAMPALRAALPVIRAHHERQDGRGYPDALEGSAIPPSARAFQVADAYDAMTTGRHYRPRRSHAEAIDVLSRGAGTTHDAEAVNALAAVEEER